MPRAHPQPPAYRCAQPAAVPSHLRSRRGPDPSSPRCIPRPAESQTARSRRRGCRPRREKATPRNRWDSGRTFQPRSSAPSGAVTFKIFAARMNMANEASASRIRSGKVGAPDEERWRHQPAHYGGYSRRQEQQDQHNPSRRRGMGPQKEDRGISAPVFRKAGGVHGGQRGKGCASAAEKNVFALESHGQSAAAA